MVELIWELETWKRGVELRVVVHISTCSFWDITECLEVFVYVLWAPSEREQIEWYLWVSQLNSSILEEAICWWPQVHSLSTLFWWIFTSWWLKFWMSQDHVRYLEEYHFTSDHLNDVIGWLKSRYEAWFGSMIIQEIIWHVIEEIDYQIVAIMQVYKQVFILRHENVFWVSTYHHLGLLESWLQVVEVDMTIICQECYFCPLICLASQKLLLNHTFHSWTGKC